MMENDKKLSEKFWDGFTAGMFFGFIIVAIAASIKEYFL